MEESKHISKKIIITNNIAMIILFSTISIFISRLLPILIANISGVEYVEGFNGLSILRIIIHLMIGFIIYKIIVSCENKWEKILSTIIPSIVFICSVISSLFYTSIFGGNAIYNNIILVINIILYILIILKILNINTKWFLK